MRVFWISTLLFAMLALRPAYSQESHSDFALGVHLLLDSEGIEPFPMQGWREQLYYAHLLTGDGGWVAQVVQANDMNVDKWQAFLDDCWRLDLRPVLRLASAPDHINGYWSIPSLEQAEAWAQFLTALRLDQPIYVVVGNEPNSGGEWGGQPNPAEYAAYFTAVAEALSDLNQPIEIAMAGFDHYAPHTNFQFFPNSNIQMMDTAAFLDGLFAAEPNILDYVDFWAGHVYPLGAFHRPPWEQTYQVDRIFGAEATQPAQPPSGIYNRGVNGYQWERWYIETVIGKSFPDKILITEFGYRHQESVFLDATDSGGALVDVNAAAIYLDMAIYGNHGHYPDLPEAGWLPLADDPSIMGVILFALAGRPEYWGHTNLLIVDEAGKVLDTYPMFDVLVNRHD